MSDADIRAIAVYLKDCRPANRSRPSTPPPAAEMAAGKALYDRACVACHETDGSGAPRIYSAAARQRQFAVRRPSAARFASSSTARRR